MPAIRIGAQVKPQHTSFADYRHAWRALDELGVDSLWTWDHFFPLFGRPEGPHFEGWTSLAVCAGETRRAAVGCLVHSIGYRNPALLSAMAKTLDHAVGGRLILGLGAGWFARDYREYGYDFGAPGDRLRDLERGVEIIRARWAKDEPKPLRGTIPILIGGDGERVTLRITARLADLWNGFGPVRQWARKNRILDEWCTRLGRDPAAIERTALIEAHEIDNLEAFVGAGATHVICGLGAPFDTGPLRELLAWRDRRA